VVHVVDLSDFPIDPDSFDWDTAAEAAQEEQRRQVTRELAHFGGPWTFNLQRATPPRVLTDMATQSAALMVVIGSGRSGALIDPYRRCPLLVVPAGCAGTAGIRRGRADHPVVAAPRCAAGAVHHPGHQLGDPLLCLSGVPCRARQGHPGGPRARLRPPSPWPSSCRRWRASRSAGSWMVEGHAW
jgi:hypothetical protein